MPTATEEKVEGQTDELEEGAQLHEEDGQQKEQKKPDTSSEEMKTALASLAKSVDGLTKKDEKKEDELTAEQKSELWAVYNPEATRADFMKKFFRMNDDATPEQITEAKELFADMQKGLTRQAIVGARNFIEIAKQELRDEMKDALAFVSEAKAEKAQKEFYKKYPVLEDEAYAKIVTIVAKNLKESDFKDKDSYFKALADNAAETIKAVKPDFDLGAEKQEKKPAGTTPRIPRTTMGGGGGAGGGRQTVPEKTATSDVDSIELD